MTSKLDLAIKEIGVVKKKLDEKFDGTNWAPYKILDKLDTSLLKLGHKLHKHDVIVGAILMLRLNEEQSL